MVGMNFCFINNPLKKVLCKRTDISISYIDFLLNIEYIYIKTVTISRKENETYICIATH